MRDGEREGGQFFCDRELEKERDCEIEKVRIQIIVTALIFFGVFFSINFFRFSHLELVYF